MAVTVVNLSDTVTQWVTKTNTISSDLGDKANLLTTANSDLVVAINELFNRKTTDSDAIHAMHADTTTIDFSVNSGTGKIEHKVIDDSIVSAKFNSKITVNIKDASNNILKTLYSPVS